MDNKEIPYGYCHCGCGQKTSISKGGGGYKSGEPKKFINHHASRLTKKEVFPKICLACGKVFYPRKASRQERQVTCSYMCRQKYISTSTIEQRADMLRGRGEGKTYSKRYGRHEHRIVMEQILGRPLGTYEVVHHKDGNKKNNSPENLELMDQSLHASLHFTQYWAEKKEGEMR